MAMLSSLRAAAVLRTPLSSSPLGLGGAVRHATKKAGGSTKNGRDSPGQHFGVKLGAGARCRSGNIIVTQRGTLFRPGLNVKMGKNHTLYCVAGGTKTDDREYVVKFEKIFHNTKKRKLVSAVLRDEYNFGSKESPVYMTEEFMQQKEERAHAKMLRKREEVLELRASQRM